MSARSTGGLWEMLAALMAVAIEKAHLNSQKNHHHGFDLKRATGSDKIHREITSSSSSVI